MSRRVLVVGGGYAGLTFARRVSRKLHGARVTLVNPTAYMTYQPLLPETAAGSVNPAHVVVPLRSALPHVDVLTASLAGLDLDGRVAEMITTEGRTVRLAYDEIVLALGSVTRVLPIPGLVEHAIGFRTVEEAMYLGNRVLSRLDLASSSNDEESCRRALTFVFVGGGYAGVEALAEVEDMVRRNLSRYGLSHRRPRWVLVEAADRILPQLPERLATYAERQLTGRGVEVRTGTALAALSPGGALLDDGTMIETDTVVWTAGVVASPLLAHLGFEVDRAGRVLTDVTLRVPGHEGVWALGDCAAVPDEVAGGVCAPTAQHAVRQAIVAADNLIASARGGSDRGYRHKDAGAVASLGLGKGVAELYGVPVRGYLAWLVHRVYHGSRLPCGRRRFQVVLLWLIGFISRDPVALHALETPRRPLQQAQLLQSASIPDRDVLQVRQ